MDQFKAVLISRDEEKKQSVDWATLTPDDLMEGDVTVRVHHSTVNYKDGLAITGKSPVVRRWPMIPGIDFVGEVVSSDHADYQAGDWVVLNGWGVGETHYGGYAQLARVSGDWLVPLPDGLTAKETMSVGTAGYTAMLSVLALEEAGVTPDQGPVLVTGANGGVGSIAVLLLSQLGFEVHASTGRTDQEEFLRGLGAHEIIDRATLSEPGRPLGGEVWAGAVDSVGSHTLANVLAQTKRGGTVAACGLAQGFDLPSTVMPFILRGVRLQGVDSVMAPKERRVEAWSRIATLLGTEQLASISTEVSFDQVVQACHDILDGKIRGRVVVNID